MGKVAKSGFPVIGVLFLVLGVFKFLSGEASVVWFVLAFLFGAFGIFGSRNKDGSDAR
ncbi:MAG: hypothetical protein R3E02_05475 [Blastomonas sp.]